MYVVLIVVIILSAIFLTFPKLFLGRRRPGRTIPGPSLLQGLKLFLKSTQTGKLYVDLPDLARKYGDMMQLDLLVARVLIVNDADVYRKLVTAGEFRNLTNDRPGTFVGNFHAYEGRDIILADHVPEQIERKKVFVAFLKRFEGSGQHFENRMSETLNDLKAGFKTGKNVKFSSQIRGYILNIVCLLLTGHTSEQGLYDLMTIEDFTKSLDEIFLIENETLLHTFPFLRFVPGLKFKALHENLTNSAHKLHQAFFYAVKATHKPGLQRGFIDDLLTAQHELDQEGRPQLFDDEAVKALIQNVVVGAYLTTSSTVETLFLHLLHRQDIQDRIFREIVDVIGASPPSLHHRPSMPYTESVILETLRLSALAPFYVPHRIREDVLFDEYVIPKGTVLQMNSWFNLHSEERWVDPWTFQPSRFLDDNGSLLNADHPKRRQLLPFGVGPRMCPGEALAKSKIFMIVTTLLQHVQLLPPEDGSVLPSADPRDWPGSAVLKPANYTCKVLVR